MSIDELGKLLEQADPRTLRDIVAELPPGERIYWEPLLAKLDSLQVGVELEEDLKNVAKCAAFWRHIANCYEYLIEKDRELRLTSTCRLN